MRLLTLALLTGALAAGCAGASGHDSGGSDKLVTISDVGQVGAAFNAERGHPRLLLLLSPT
jgi:hypothetical protein